MQTSTGTGGSTTPTLTSPTLGVLVLAALTGLPELAHTLLAADLPWLPTWLRHTLAVVALVAAWVSPLLTRHSVVQAVQAVETKVGTVAQVTAAMADPNDTPTRAQVAAVQDVVKSSGTGS